MAATPASGSEMAERVLNHLNKRRRDYGRPAVLLNSALMAAAQAHAVAMAEQNFGGSVGPDGVSVADLARRGGYSGEVTYVLLDGDGEPRDAIEFWLRDEKDRSVLLHQDSDDFGMGYHVGNSGGKWIVVLGTPSAAVAGPVAPASAASQRTPAQSKETKETKEITDDIRQQVLNLINHQRSLKRLLFLAGSDALDKAAQIHAMDMARRNYTDYTSPDGHTLDQRAEEAGYHGQISSVIQFHPHTPASLCEILMEQARGMLLDPNYLHLGIGMVHDRWVVSCGQPAVSGSAATVQGMHLLVNNLRQQAGVPDLELIESLNQAAVNHSTDMVRRRYYNFAHPDGVGVATQVKSVGYVGQVTPLLAKDKGTPQEALDVFLRGEQGKKLLLHRSFHHLGVGVYESHWTLLLGTGNPAPSP